MVAAKGRLKHEDHEDHKDIHKASLFDSGVLVLERPKTPCFDPRVFNDDLNRKERQDREIHCIVFILEKPLR